MPKFLIQGSYLSDGVAGLLKEGGSERKHAVEQAVETLGGRVEAMYYAFGQTDVFIIVDLPSPVSAVAGSLATNASGAVKASYTVLITPEEVDQAAEQVRQSGAGYRPPGR